MLKLRQCLRSASAASEAAVCAGLCWGHGAEGNSPLPKGSGQAVVPIQHPRGCCWAQSAAVLPEGERREWAQEGAGSPSWSRPSFSDGFAAPLGGGRRGDKGEPE